MKPAPKQAIEISPVPFSRQYPSSTDKPLPHFYYNMLVLPVANIIQYILVCFLVICFCLSCLMLHFWEIHSCYSIARVCAFKFLKIFLCMYCRLSVLVHVHLGCLWCLAIVFKCMKYYCVIINVIYSFFFYFIF